MNRNYELVVILDPEQKAEEQEKLLSKIKSFITDSEGKISKSKELGKKEFTYPILKKKSGIYWALDISIPSEKTASVKQKIQMEEKVLRYLMVNKEE